MHAYIHTLVPARNVAVSLPIARSLANCCSYLRQKDSNCCARARARVRHGTCLGVIEAHSGGQRRRELDAGLRLAVDVVAEDGAALTTANGGGDDDRRQTTTDDDGNTQKHTTVHCTTE